MDRWEGLAADQLENLWFPYPGMYGGFSMFVHRDLLVEEGFD